MAKTDEKTAPDAQAPVDTSIVEQGYRGVKADPRPNSDYSLESGPDSPSAAEQRADALRAQADQLTAPNQGA